MQGCVLKMEGITNIYIEKVLARAKCQLFKGCFSADNIELNLLDEPKFSFICNTAKQDQEGEHFVTVIVNDDSIYYIDTFANHCENEPILSFLQKLKKPIFCNYKQIQHNNSVCCGFFCILFVLYFEKPQSFDMSFSNELEQNDKICERYIKKLLTN